MLTDASRSGNSFALIQEGPDGQKRLITCGSRGLNLAEAHYAPVEFECLGVIYAIQKCAFYIMGPPKPFTVVVNGKCLVYTLLELNNLSGIGNLFKAFALC